MHVSAVWKEAHVIILSNAFFFSRKRLGWGPPSPSPLP